MDVLQIKGIKRKILRKLYSVPEIKDDKNLQITLDKHISSPFFVYELNKILNEKNFLPSNILNLCSPLLNDLCTTSPDDWLTYIYNYSLSKNFEDAVTIKLNSILNLPCEVYLKIFKILCNYEKLSGNNDLWHCKYPLIFLTDNEVNNLERKDEYLKFIRGFNKGYVYELMRLNGEIFNFNTLDHVCGVHYLALFLGRQLKEKNIPIDLGRISGAAAGHDIGKYGCKGEELKRVPHLHYYYTDQWFKKQNITYIRNIATKHSVWDLELENLSLESLILIYCDFRVKNNFSPHGPSMHIFSLEKSFEVILDKLENINKEKETRYKKVYEKLKDFENFLHSINISTNPSNPSININYIPSPVYSLLEGNHLTLSIKNLTINHNIRLMYLLRDEYSLNAILEQGRSELNWKNLRQYIRILDEYSTYFTQLQKLQTINFLYENLTHEEDDIRRHCALAIGKLIGTFDEGYGKELPKNTNLEEPITNSFNLFYQYLDLMLYPNNKFIPLHKSWLGYSTKIMVHSLFNNIAKEKIKDYRDILFKFYDFNQCNSYDAQLFLLDTAKYISLENFHDNISVLLDFILVLTKKRNIDMRLSALESLNSIIPKLHQNETFLNKICDFLKPNTIKSKHPSENFLYSNIFSKLNMKVHEELYKNYCLEDESNISSLFLSNLKSATSWIVKKHQISILLQHSLHHSSSNSIQTCIHFCNMLKVSESEAVRNKAGSSLLKLMPSLSISERNEIAIELLRGLEIEGQKFTEYIPPFLGKVLLWLKPNELDEIINDLKYKIKTSRGNIKILILKTIGSTISNYETYTSRFSEDNTVSESRLRRMISIILNGIGDYNNQVKEAAIMSLGKDIFGSTTLNLKEKLYIFKLCCKKLLTLIGNDNNDRLLLLTNSAALNHIYRFISNYSFSEGSIVMDSTKKIAFFPGTFDPFSLGHKYIATTIRDMGYEVYLSVDEFSWSKKTLPNLLRKTLINLSICDEFNIYIYPENMPINIANPNDLKVLKETFKNHEIYFVSGGDVLLNASCYQKSSEENSIHTFPHIIFERGNSKKLEEAKSTILREVTVLNVPPKYANISSSQIRSCIDKNKDISALVDPLVSQYITENGFYQREPLNKLCVNTINLDFRIIEELSEADITEICNKISTNTQDIGKLLSSLLSKESAKVVLILDTTSDEIIAISAMHWVRSNNLFKEICDEDICNALRGLSLGRLIILDGFYVSPKEKYNNLEQIIITETLAFAIAKDYEYGLFMPFTKNLSSPKLVETLILQGFLEMNETTSDIHILLVNMTNPCILNLDIENIIKEPFKSNSKVKTVVDGTRKLLQETILKLYPENLLLSFDSDFLYQKLIKNICMENKVSTNVSDPQSYGKNMCVPYGDVLDKYIVPNTVTKSLHTEKYYNGDLSSSFIGEAPYYLPLGDQLKTIKSFNRPVLLVDNILHKGYRIRAIAPLIDKERIKVNKILCGILSGRGKDLMDMQNKKVSSVYFIPRLNVWFSESLLYPFIGGDGLWRGEFPIRNLIPSTNSILPYNYPVFLKGVSHEDVYNLSKICLENSLSILKVLEHEYHNLYNKSLNLGSLGQVITIPRNPDIGKGINYDLSTTPSTFVEKDLELLKRLGNILPNR